MINDVVRTLPEDASGMDLNRAVLSRMSSLEQDPYQDVLASLREEVRAFFGLILRRNFLCGIIIKQEVWKSKYKPHRVSRSGKYIPAAGQWWKCQGFFRTPEGFGRICNVEGYGQ